MSTHNLCCREKIIYTPVHPSFAIQKWDVMGSKYHRCVSMMLSHTDFVSGETQMPLKNTTTKN